VIIAVDFDGVLCRDEFPNIGMPMYGMITFIRQARKAGVEVILWTCRVGERLEEALKWCEAHGLEFDAINDNAPSNICKYNTNPRKVYADFYIDDRAIAPRPPYSTFWDSLSAILREARE
jgi:hypothetical protein